MAAEDCAMALPMHSAACVTPGDKLNATSVGRKQKYVIVRAGTKPL